MTTSKQNKPAVHSFWQRYIEVTGKVLPSRIDTSKKPTKEMFSSLLGKLHMQSADQQTELARLYLKESNISEGGFRNIVSIFGKIPQEEEIAIIREIINHRRFSQVDAFELKERAHKLKTPGLGKAIEENGSSITKNQIESVLDKVEKALERTLSPSASR